MTYFSFPHLKITISRNLCRKHPANIPQTSRKHINLISITHQSHINRISITYQSHIASVLILIAVRPLFSCLYTPFSFYNFSILHNFPLGSTTTSQRSSSHPICNYSPYTLLYSHCFGKRSQGAGHLHSHRKTMTCTTLPKSQKHSTTH